MKTNHAMLRATPVVHASQAACLALALLLTGCCTPALWQERAYQPAANPRLHLARSTQSGDVLVQYDECRVNNKKAHPRAYWLFTYQTRMSYTEPPPKPEFVDPQTVSNLVTVPIYLFRTSGRTPTNSDFYAVYADNLHSFELWKGPKKVGDYRLPFYSTRWSTPGHRIALTPLAIAGDGVFITSILVESAFDNPRLP